MNLLFHSSSGPQTKCRPLSFTPPYSILYCFRPLKHLLYCSQSQFPTTFCLYLNRSHISVHPKTHMDNFSPGNFGWPHFFGQALQKDFQSLDLALHIILNKLMTFCLWHLKMTIFHTLSIFKFFGERKIMSKNTKPPWYNKRSLTWGFTYYLLMHICLLKTVYRLSFLLFQKTLCPSLSGTVF